MQHEAIRIADALRLNVADLDEKIFTIRRLHQEGKVEKASRHAVWYLDYLRRCHEQAEMAKSVGGKGPLFDAMHPIPFNAQLVGLSAEEYQERKWKGVADDFPFPAHAGRFLEAAE